MICISFEQVMECLVSKFSKEKPIFLYFAFFSIGKARGHMILPFLELVKFCLQNFKSHMTMHMTISHDFLQITTMKTCFTIQQQSKLISIFFFLSSFPQHPLHQMVKFFLLSGLFFICFLLVPPDHHENLLNPGKLHNEAYNLYSDHLASG